MKVPAGTVAASFHAVWRGLAHRSVSVMLRGMESSTSSPLHDRIHAIVGRRTSKSVAEMTGTNAETVRRYLSGADPSVEFLAALCRAANVNGEWLLTGRGPMHRKHLRTHALDEASVSELLSAMARSLEKLALRVERLEHYAQTLEARVRAAGLEGTLETGGRDGGAESQRSEAGSGDGASKGRARSIGDAVAQRPRAAAD